MKRTKFTAKLIAVVMAALIAALSMFMAGCSPYSSHYSAIGFVHSNDSHSARMSFYRFKGSISFQMKCTTDSKLIYSASLESGDITVYYDEGNGKEELLTVGSGDAMDGVVPLKSSGKVYVIVESEGNCENGSFRFEIG
ncbi:MAG: hypothetical protein IKH41_02450 [Clostridia bacterium]|nr:hypothetical protein [Clostridia bacterium]